MRGIAQETGELGIENLRDITDFFRSDIRDVSVAPPSRVDIAGEELTFEGLQAQRDLLQAELDRIGRGAEATPEQRELIGRIAEERISAGQADITNALQENLRLLRSELAPSIGLRPEDTPILDRGNLLARESLRESGNLVSEARAGEAAALLNFPLAESELKSSQTRGQQSINLALQDFQNRLRTEAFQRRLATGGLGLSLAGVQPSPIGFTPPGQITKSKSSGAATPGVAGESFIQFSQGFGQGLGSMIGGG